MQGIRDDGRQDLPKMVTTITIMENLRLRMWSFLDGCRCTIVSSEALGKAQLGVFCIELLVISCFDFLKSSALLFHSYRFISDPNHELAPNRALRDNLGKAAGTMSLY